MSKKLLLPGDTAPWFTAPTLDGPPRFPFDSVAGRPIVLLFLGNATWPGADEALATLAHHREIFDDKGASFFGISSEPADAAAGRIAHSVPGIRWYFDYDAGISRLYNAIEIEGTTARYTPHWILLDRTLRVVAVAPLGAGETIFAALSALNAAPESDGPGAPVLVVPRVLEPALCQQLIAGYEREGGRPTGFMRQENGKTVEKIDPRYKRRSDWTIKDEALGKMLLARIKRFLVPPIKRALQFEVRQVERLIVSCYDSESGGFFRSHRDDTVPGTEHRRFACTINLNAEEFEGGDLRFPEYGPRTYRAPTGGAVIFSCSLLHEALPVTSGKRYAFLPFLYNDEDAKIREANLHHLAPRDDGPATETALAG